MHTKTSLSAMVAVVGTVLFAGLQGQGGSLVETQASQFGGTYQQLSLTGIRQYCAEVLDAARYPNTLRLESVNQKYGVVVQPADGSLRFVGLNPAVVSNTAPNGQMAIRDAIQTSKRMLELGSSVNQPLGPYEVVSECRNALTWLSMAVQPQYIQRTKPVEIDPNPMNQLPPGWEKSIQKAELRTQKDGWRELHRQELKAHLDTTPNFDYERTPQR